MFASLFMFLLRFQMCLFLQCCLLIVLRVVIAVGHSGQLVENNTKRRQSGLVKQIAGARQLAFFRILTRNNQQHGVGHGSDNLSFGENERRRRVHDNEIGFILDLFEKLARWIRVQGLHRFVSHGPGCEYFQGRNARLLQRFVQSATPGDNVGQADVIRKIEELVQTGMAQVTIDENDLLAAERGCDG